MRTFTFLYQIEWNFRISLADKSHWCLNQERQIHSQLNPFGILEDLKSIFSICLKWSSQGRLQNQFQTIHFQNKVLRHLCFQVINYLFHTKQLQNNKLANKDFFNQIQYNIHRLFFSKIDAILRICSSRIDIVLSLSFSLRFLSESE